MSWKEEALTLIISGGTDSDIEELIDRYPGVKRKDVWNLVYNFKSPKECHGCRYVGMDGMYPCTQCYRGNNAKILYLPR